MPYIPTIGLEIHAELKTRTKMFCDSKNDPDETRPNVNICPVCMAHPGTLPVINREAVKHVVKMGVAMGGEIADFTEFDRKNYFYPDIPKGYQISQYKFPLVKGGSLAGVLLTRIHLEEDTAKSVHEEDGSLIDFNRAGVPLMELVTEPVIHDPKIAANFAKELQLLLRYLGAGEANMEKGQMRVEANISVSKDPHTLGTKVEIKNLNSFRSVERAIEFEIKRQTELLEKGGKVVQETRGWDEGKQKTFSQRLKEESHDYRYFPDPDLPKLYLSRVSEFAQEILKAEMSELPSEKRTRYFRDYGLKEEDVEVYIQDESMAWFVEAAIDILGKDKEVIQMASNYLTSDIQGYIREKGISLGKLPLTPESFARVISLTHEGSLSSRGAKETLRILLEKGGDADAIVKEKGLLQKSDTGELMKIVLHVIDTHPKVAADFKAGKAASLQFLVGQGMKESRGAANPEVLRRLLEEKLH